MGAAGWTEQAWSASRLLFGLGDLHDEEGRPLGERRASSEAKRGCPMELVPCPYEDERQGIAMNLSALEQIKQHLGPVHADVRALHASLPAGLDPWSRMFLAVLDQAMAPALWVLREGPGQAIPGTAATGHKLAAGLFNVMHRLATDEARGVVIEPNVDALMRRVHETGALIGGGGHEACAGPPKLIHRTTAVFLGCDAPRSAGAAVDPVRVAVATTLHEQIRLGIVLRLFEEAAEQRLLRRVQASLTPRNPFIRSKLEARLSQLDTAPPAVALEQLTAAIPQGIAEREREGLARAINSLETPASDGQRRALFERLLHSGRGALRLDDEQAAAEVATWTDAVLRGRAWVVASLWVLEGRLRSALAPDNTAPIRFSSTVLPPSWMLPWFGAISGYQISLSIQASPRTSLRGPDGRLEELGAAVEP